MVLFLNECCVFSFHGEVKIYTSCVVGVLPALGRWCSGISLQSNYVLVGDYFYQCGGVFLPAYVGIRGGLSFPLEHHVRP